MTSRGPPAVLFILFYLRAGASAFMENAQLLFRSQAFIIYPAVEPLVYRLRPLAWRFALSFQ